MTALSNSWPNKLRCAVYTRKSTEHGLDQEFNSLDNQREAAEAYIKSQAHEGWRLMPEAYDDGGVSGGSLDRPALQRLLAKVRAGQIDVIVVYKVDRLTRSLADFAKLVELFDQHGTSFVSVTQAFNTTTSMGRLTLNVLLSFAQFEREVTGERIRDKIAASKRKGMRVGGPVPLGYGVREKKLVPCPKEAEEVRLIFRRYLELGSLVLVMQDLQQRLIITKVSPRRDGTVRGGIAFNKSGLSQLLKNRCYIGEVVHKGRHYKGEHEPIVPTDLFQAVQDALRSQSHGANSSVVNGSSLLRGLLYDARGNRMTPSSAKKNGAVYRYYVSCCLDQGRKAEAAQRARVSAPDIEAVVLRALGIEDLAAEHAGASLAGESMAGKSLRTPTPDRSPAPSHRERLLDRGTRIILHADRIEIVPRAEADEAQPAPIVVPWIPARRPRREILGISEPGRAARLRTQSPCG